MRCAKMFQPDDDSASTMHSSSGNIQRKSFITALSQYSLNSGRPTSLQTIRQVRECAAWAEKLIGLQLYPVYTAIQEIKQEISCNKELRKGNR